MNEITAPVATATNTAISSNLTSPGLALNSALSCNMQASQRPVVGISACRKQLNPHPFHVVGEKYVTAVVEGASATPMLIPPMGTALDLDHVLDCVDGILLTGSPSNVEPQHYGADAAGAVPPHDAQRDATTLPLIKRAVERGVPMFAICRGCQEVNVAFGGSLRPKVQECEGMLDHREDHSQPLDHQYAPSHEVRLRRGGMLARLAGTDRVMGNSLHGQGVDRLAERLVVEALAPDDLVEAFTIEGASAFSLRGSMAPGVEGHRKPVFHGDIWGVRRCLPNRERVASAFKRMREPT